MADKDKKSGDAARDKKDGDAVAGETVKKGFKLPKLAMFGAIGVVALLLIGGGVYFFLFAGGKPVGDNVPKREEAAKIEAFYLDLPEMVINLTSADARPTFVKLDVSLQVPEKAMIDQIQPQLPKVQDAFQLYLRELRLTDLQGSAGMFRLKEELQRRINLIVYPAKVDDILFRSLLVQ